MQSWCAWASSPPDACSYFHICTADCPLIFSVKALTDALAAHMLPVQNGTRALVNAKVLVALDAVRALSQMQDQKPSSQVGADAAVCLHLTARVMRLY